MSQKQNFVILNFSFDLPQSEERFKQLLFAMVNDGISIIPLKSSSLPGTNSDFTIKFEGERMLAMRAHLTVLWFQDFMDDRVWEEALRASL